MDLATKSKNINGFVKFLVILLSVATMFGAFQCGVEIYDFAGHYGEETLDALRGETVIPLDSFKVRTTTFGIADCLTAIAEEGATEINEDAIEKLYGNEDGDYYGEYAYYTQYTSALKYYIVNNKTKTTLTNFKKEDNYKTIINDKKFAFSSVSGVARHTPTLDDKYLFNCDKYIDAYFYFDVKDNGFYDGDVGLDDIVATSINSAFELSSINVQLKGILAIVLALVSVFLAIYAMIICGNRDKDGKVKPIFLDYVPLDIHLGITGGLIALAVIGIAILADEADIGVYTIEDSVNLRFWLYAGMSACAAGIQLLIIEFFTSLIRNCKSARKWYKTTLVTFIIYLLIKLDVAIFNRIKSNQPKRRARRKAFKDALGYKPEAFKRRIILFLVGYGLLNVFLLIMGMIWFDVANWSEMGIFWGIVNLFCFLALNITSLVFVAKYIYYLDKIIVASANRTMPNVNYDKLPKSLQMLVDSIQYSNKELSNAVAKAVKDERMRTELITNVSHDLKTPLTSIINYVDLLKQCDINDENAKEYIEVLDEKGIKLKRLIEDLLEASKVTSGVITLNPVTLDLSELATQAIVEHQQEFVENSLELVFKGDSRNVTAFVDGNKTFRVIENLLSNAKKYSAKGTRVYSDVFEENNMSVFEIKNISAEPLDITADELKERFVRGDKSRTNEGNGLGLSIADNLCLAMGGKLELSIDGDLFKAKVILPKTK